MREGARWRSATRRVAAIAVLGAVGACSGGGLDPEPRWNVVIALVDTLRADHLGAYGYARNTSPHIDRFGSESIVFRNARAQAPCTFPSVNSLLTSRDPAVFRNQLALMIGIPERFPSVAELLREQGYRTAAISASVVVRKTRSGNNYFGGFGRGFDRFDEQCEEREAACVNRRALAWLDESDASEQPFLLYLHYIDPHDPYQPPSSHERRFTRAYRGAASIARGNPNPIAARLAKDRSASVLERDVEHLVDLYDEEIAYFDERFAELLAELEARGLTDRTLVVLLSDHGEDFMEFRSVKHCRSVRDTQVRTPLIVRVPGDPGGRVVTEAAGNIDVVPTVLDYLGIDPTASQLEGESLRPWIEGKAGGPESTASRIAFAAWTDWRAVVRGNYKLILHEPSQNARLFDLSSDPGETRDIRLEQPGVAAALRDAVLERVAQLARPQAPAADGDPSSQSSDSAGPRDDSVERLEALGYLE